MYRFLLSWRWLGAFVLALVVAAGCVVLGQWQWDRREQRLERNALVTGNYDREPSTLAQVLGNDPATLPAGAEWTPVSLQGSYLPEQAVLLRNRPLDGRSGYHALVPFEVRSPGPDDGAVLLVDRGWLPSGQTGTGPDDVPAPPAGDVQVVVRLRPAEPGGDRDAPAGQVQSITPDVVPVPQAVEDRLVTGAYGVLGQETPSPERAPRLLPRPEIDEGPHLSYSLQWFVFAAGALVGFVILIRRTADEDVPSAEPRARRSRRTAEEEEDALVDAQLRQDQR